MARTSYSAPGVYVEEVPSAQQPIAGVGTNVVGFIGIVPSRIYVPVPNPQYDPVIARAMLERVMADAQGSPGGAPDAEQAKAEGAVQRALEVKRQQLENLKAEAQRLKGEAERLEDAAKEADTKVKEANAAWEAADAASKEEKAAALGSAKEALAAATRAAKKARTEANNAATGVADLEDAIKNTATAAPAAAGVAAAGVPAAAAKDGAAGAAAPLPGDVIVQKDAQRFAAPTPEEIAEMLKPSFVQPYMLQEVPIAVDVFETKFCTNFTEYTQRFGSFSAYRSLPDAPASDNPEKWTFSPLHAGHHALTHAVNGFFRNGGTKAYVARIESAEQLEAALARFKTIDDLAIIVAPGLPRNKTTWNALIDFVELREDCFAILDAPEVIDNNSDEDLDIVQLSYANANWGTVMPRVSKNAAYYLPHIEVSDPAKQLQDADPQRKVAQKYQGLTYVAPSGHLAGIYARTDTERGVHKAPANCVVRGAGEVRYYISKSIQEQLNPQGVNAIRMMNGAITVWGARTMGGDANREWKYISVRRLFIFLKRSIEEGTQWIVFEPNDEALWGKIRLNITAFLTNVWRSGALFGATPEQGFYVKCDAELNPPEVRDVGQVITEIGVAIVRPAEFVIFRITQASGIGRA